MKKQKNQVFGGAAPLKKIIWHVFVEFLMTKT